MLRHKEPEQSEEGSKHSAVLMDSPENPRKSTDYEYNKGKQPVSQKKIAPCKEHQSRHNIIRERSPISEKLDSVIPVWGEQRKDIPFFQALIHFLRLIEMSPDITTGRLIS